MYPGFQLSNILESCRGKIQNILYQPHYSMFDVLMLELGIDLYTLDKNALSFFSPESNITYCDSDLLEIKSYSLFVTNNPLLHIKNNIATSMHLNTVLFSHDINLLSMKKEDMFLVCNNVFRPNDVLCYFDDRFKNFGCNKITRKSIQYCIPDSLSINNNTIARQSIGMFCLNKQLDPNYLKGLVGVEATNLSKIPSDINAATQILNNYKVLVELDCASIINILWGIACGCVGIIMDPNNLLSEYKNIPNLYIVHSIDGLKSLITKNIEYIHQPITTNNIYTDYTKFKTDTISMLNDCQRKAFIL